MSEKVTFYTCFGKRMLDLVLVVLALIVLVPLNLAVSLMVFCKMGRPVIFSQKRPGLYGKVFVLYKFRTMTEERDCQGKLLRAEERLTRFGLFLRSSSLDELPEIWNVFKGEMSLVGPRPLLEEYLQLYTPEQARRHLVKPGLTGWAQINGRNALSWEDKFDLDVWYADNVSLLLDIQILLRTVYQVVRREGVSPRDQPIAPRFQGSVQSFSPPID